MNIGNILLFTFRRIWHNKTNTVFSCILATLSFLLIGLSVYCAVAMNYSVSILNRSFVSDVDHMMMVQMIGSADKKNPNYQTAFDEMRSVPGVTAMGLYKRNQMIDLESIDADADSLQILSSQLSYGTMIGSDQKFFAPLIFSRTSSRLIPYRLEAGCDPDHTDEKNLSLLYLGYGFKDISVGSIIKINGEPMMVAGVFAQGEYIFDSDTLSNYHGFANYRVALDNEMLIVYQEEAFYDSRQIVCIDRNYHVEDIQKQMKAIAKKYDLTSYMDMPMRAHTKGLFYFYSNISDNTKNIMWLTCGIVIVVFSSLQILDTIAHIKELGIWIASGIRKKDIMRILVVQNMISIIIAFIMSNSFLYYLLIGLTGNSADTRGIMLTSCIPICSQIAVLFLLISSVAPVLYISRLKTSAIVKGDWRV